MYIEPIKIPLDKYSIIEQSIYKLIMYIDKKNLLKNIHPNIITIFRFILAVMSIFLYKRNNSIIYGIAIIFSYLLNIFLDYVDGYIARKYDKCTVLGDILDHVFDWILFYLMYSIINNKSRTNNILLIIHLILVAGYFGSHQVIHNSTNKINEILDLTKWMVIFKPEFYLLFSDVSIYFHLIVLFIYKNLL